VDYGFEPPLENLWAEVYAVDQAAFLAGYLAAAVSRTGKVATFGALNWTVVTDFMDGFARGVHHYNEVHNVQVEVLGWDVERRDGLFAGDFWPPELGAQMAGQLLEQGADVIFPVAGADIGPAAARAIREHGNAYVIGVDLDYTLLAPDLADITLTSVLKHLDVSVFKAIEAIELGNFQGGVHIGTLENGGVGLAPFYQLESVVPDSVKVELEQIEADIIAGKIKTKP
jgi:basic membrane protein A